MFIAGVKNWNVSVQKAKQLLVRQNLEQPQNFQLDWSSTDQLQQIVSKVYNLKSIEPTYQSEKS